MTRSTSSKNPWIPSSPEAEPPAPQPVAEREGVTLTGPSGPQPGVTPPEAADSLARVQVPADRLCVVGVHGGSAESTIAELLGGLATHHRWPEVDPAPLVLLTSRTSSSAVEAAQRALRAWAASTTPKIRLLGIVWVADAPGRLPRELSRAVDVASGGAPHAWHIGWDESVRRGLGTASLERSSRKAITEIQTILRGSNAK